MDPWALLFLLSHGDSSRFTYWGLRVYVPYFQAASLLNVLLGYVLLGLSVVPWRNQWTYVR